MRRPQGGGGGRRWSDRSRGRRRDLSHIVRPEGRIRCGGAGEEERRRQSRCPREEERAAETYTFRDASSANRVMTSRDRPFWANSRDDIAFNSRSTRRNSRLRRSQRFKTAIGAVNGKNRFAVSGMTLCPNAPCEPGDAHFLAVVMNMARMLQLHNSRPRNAALQHLHGRVLAFGPCRECPRLVRDAQGDR